MRKEAKTTKNAVLATVQGYHQRQTLGNYAFQGFRANKYFTSDRFIPLDNAFRRPDGKPLKGYGLEIETECRGVRNVQVLAEVFDKIIFPAFPADLFKMQHDGSLGGDSSAECITQVMTKEFIRNNYAAFKLMYDTYFPAFQISCAASGNCGMHVNLSNALFGRSEEAQQVAIKKLLYLVNRNFSFFCALTNRDISHTIYCGKMHQYSTVNGARNADLYNMPSDHSNCCNFSHFPEGRVELRIVGGQSTFPCFRNTMEAIFHVIEAVKKLSWSDLDHIEKVFAGCNQYVFDRLNTKCKQAGTITATELAAIHATIVREELL